MAPYLFAIGIALLVLSLAWQDRVQSPPPPPKEPPPPPPPTSRELALSRMNERVEIILLYSKFKESLPDEFNKHVLGDRTLKQCLIDLSDQEIQRVINPPFLFPE